MEFNREYIMKAVYHCVNGGGCAECPYEFVPECADIKELLHYINELIAENKTLEMRIDDLDIELEATIDC